MPDSQHKPWHRPQASGRARGLRERRRVLILCEDEKSSCLYFKGFQVDGERVEVVRLGTGYNTDTLVKEAISRKAEAEKLGNRFNEVWCVFDRDDFPVTNFHRAFELADSNGIQVAWSNEAFELWYLLHFNYHDTGIGRSEYAHRLKKLLGKPYDKADRSIYDQLKEHQPTALRNAQKLEANWIKTGKPHFERQNPSTSIHRLVDFLNKLQELDQD